MFNKDSDFNTISKVDKTGKRISKKDRMINNIYKIDESDQKASAGSDKSSSQESDEDEDEQKAAKFYDEEGNFNWNNDD